MRRRMLWLLCGLLLALLPGAARAEAPTRFNVNTFRPAPGARDLIIIPQTQPLLGTSLALGSYFSFTFNPLALVNAKGETFSLISNQLQWHLMAAVSFDGWIEIGAVLPVVLFQTGNLQAIGQEGSVQSTVLSDLSLLAKVPIIKRGSSKEQLAYSRGLGLAIAVRVDTPTGSQANFASDGRVNVMPSVLVDYRFKSGPLITSQVGAFFRPGTNLPNLALGPQIMGGLGAELPLFRNWGITAVGGVTLFVPVSPPPKSFQECDVNGLAGLRWYASFGVTFTVGAGLDCHFSSNPLSFFLAAVWTPRSDESKGIDQYKNPPNDPDGDGLVTEKDECPNEWGPIENLGCPDRDQDKDGIIDRLDDCPLVPGIARFRGCPLVYAEKDKINIAEQVHFATDQEVILPESFEMLEQVARLMREHPEWQEVLVEGHADIRASDAYNLDLSQRRAMSVMRFLIARGVEPSRLRAQGFGRSRPKATNSTEEGMQINRRVEFTIVRTKAPAPAAPAGKGAGAPRPGQVVRPAQPAARR